MHDSKGIQLTNEKSQIFSYLFKIKSEFCLIHVIKNKSFCREFFNSEYFSVFYEVLFLKNCLITSKKFEDFSKITKIDYFLY